MKYTVEKWTEYAKDKKKVFWFVAEDGIVFYEARDRRDAYAYKDKLESR